MKEIKCYAENICIIQKKAIKKESKENKSLRYIENQSQYGRYNSKSMNNNIRIPFQWWHKGSWTHSNGHKESIAMYKTIFFWKQNKTK